MTVTVDWVGRTVVELVDGDASSPLVQLAVTAASTVAVATRIRLATLTSVESI